MKVIVVGGGPAGMLASIAAARNNNEVLLIEKNNILGKKILVTGKGRCNLTSSVAMDEFIKNVPGNGKFLFSAFKNFTNGDIIDLVEKNGVKTKVERGNRVFPVSDKAEDVRRAIEKEVKKEPRITIKYDTAVKKLLTSDGKIEGVETEKREKIYGDRVIIATGGKSYSGTGSTGDGYKLAENVGHTIEKIRG